MGQKNRKRRNKSGIEGVLLVDKPIGPSSFDVVAAARRALNTRAIGHTGTLDPLASGLLVLLVGRYTRLSAHLVADDKTYEAQVKFGVQTNTDDAEGEPVDTGDATALSEAEVVAAIAEMQGPATQVPPAFSAISVGGERLYKKARRGEEVVVPPRDVTFYRLDASDWSEEDPKAPTVDVTVACSKGTYIRAFARDLGKRVGVPAHLSGLRRTQSGAYTIENAVTLDELAEMGAQAVSTGADHVLGIEKVEVNAEETKAFEQGKAVTTDAVNVLVEDALALAHQAGTPVALVKRRGQELVVVRGFGPPPEPDVEPDEVARPAVNPSDE